MRLKAYHIKKFVAVIVLIALNVGLSSFTGKKSTTDDGKSFSLKNFNRYQKNYALHSLKLSQFNYAGSQQLMESKSNNPFHVQMMMKWEKGNTTYIMPYSNGKVPLAKFKTPLPRASH